MKIIFDSEEAKKDFLDNRCPGCDVSKKLRDIGYDDRYDTCLECWETSGIELEVK